MSGYVGPSAFSLRLVESARLSPTVHNLILERVDGEAVAFSPGQWVNLLFDAADPKTGEPLKRAYSIASPPDGPRIELCVTRVEGGAASSALHALEPGAVLRATGPHGLFVRPPNDSRPSLFVGTGSGVAPLRSMIAAALRAEPTGAPPLRLLFGVRSEEQILYRSELDELARVHPRFRYRVTLSRPDEGWNGARGYVQDHVADAWSELVAASEGAPPSAFVCGLERMVRAVRDRLRSELGVDRRRVLYEKYD
ncbi:MAG: FAD-dependent oxidoreductase [Polyangiaceae bacterium]